MAKVLVIAEQRDGVLKKTTLEVIGASKSKSATVAVALIGEGVGSLADQLAHAGADEVYLVDNSALKLYSPEGYSAAAAQVAQQSKASVILASATPYGKDLLPRLAAKINAGMLSDLVDMNFQGNKLVGKRPMYAGKCLCMAEATTAITVATIRPNSFPQPSLDTGKKASPVAVQADVGQIRAVCTEIVKGKSTKPDLTEANIIVSGGRAMGNADNFKILNDLADVIDATVGASRAAVDSGYAPHSMQVGQTGKTVNPSLYIACGISGAIQHLAGMRTSKVIVAINKDPEAPIFQRADYGIVGDLFQVVPALTAECKKLTQG